MKTASVIRGVPCNSNPTSTAHRVVLTCVQWRYPEELLRDIFRQMRFAAWKKSSQSVKHSLVYFIPFFARNIAVLYYYREQAQKLRHLTFGDQLDGMHKLGGQVIYWHHLVTELLVSFAGQVNLILG